MVEIRMKKLFLMVLISLVLITGSGQALSSKPLDEPGITSVSSTEKEDQSNENKPENNQPAVKSEKGRRYSYTLASDKTNKAGEYTRKEIESFLCASAPGYIRTEDLYKVATTGEYFVNAKNNLQNQKKMAENGEINKWFEDHFTVTSKGNLTVLDIETIEGFFKKINQIIGKEKFFYDPGLDVANIIIELVPPEKFFQSQYYTGETSLLKDNLGVRITTSDRKPKPHIETYNKGIGKLINESSNTKFTPRELEFRKNNRLVKVVLKNVLDPHTRYFAFTHELLHSIGFTGHSPYHESHLFPLPVRAYNDSCPAFGIHSPVLSKLAQVMVEVLYRPEILPGMTIKEASEVITRLKRIEKCKKNEIIDYLHVRKTRLESQKKAILEKEETKYNNRMKKYIELDQLVMKEQWYLEELEEIRVDYQLEAKVVEDIRAATSKIAKLVRIRRELILAESQKKRLLEKTVNLKNKKEASKTRRDIKRLGEEIVVLNDLLKVEEKITALERNILAKIPSFSEKQVNEKLRRILRQLLTINKELESLHQ